MKKIRSDITTIILVNLVACLLLSINMYVKNDLLALIMSLILIFVFACSLFILLNSLISRLAYKNYVAAKMKVYMMMAIAFAEYFLIKYVFSLLSKFCEISNTWDIKSKIILDGFIVIFIALAIYSIYIIHSNNSKVSRNKLTREKFDEKFKKNIETTKEIDNYLNDDSIDGALLIDGSWGSGKTYYIEKYIDMYNTINVNNKKRAVYVSLNGLKSIEDVNNALFAALHPVLSSIKKSPIVNVLNCATKYTMNLINLDIDSISEINLDFTKYNAELIVFDDIERCQVNIPELFGYIDLIKKSCSKIVLIADEKELINYLFPVESFYNKSIASNILIAKKMDKKEDEEKDDKIEKILSKIDKVDYSRDKEIIRELENVEKAVYPIRYYDVIKEKIIWRAIPFGFNIDIVWEEFVEPYKEKKFIDLIKKNKEIIIDVEEKSKCSNLRTYKYALDFLNKNYSIIDSHSFENKDELEKNLIFNVFALTISYKQPLKSFIDSKTKIGYKGYDILSSMYNYNSGIKCDPVLLKEELEEIDRKISEEKRKETPSYILNLREDWIYMSDVQLSKCIEDLVEAYENGEIKYIYFIPCYHFLYKYKNEYGFELTNINLDDVKKELINRAGESEESIELDNFYFIEMQYPKNEVDDLKEIWNALREMTNRNKERTIVNDVFSISEMTIEKLKNISDEAMGRKAFLSLFPINELMQFIRGNDNKVLIEFYRLVKQVYNFTSLGNYFTSDKIAIANLINELENYFNVCESKIKKKLLEWFISELRNILSRF